ncbi:MAG: hypothetical protein HYY00_03200 [Chloroflexi bacterium]|nr:hypothetical protein [Chloroflexota bacterium]
MIFVSAGSPSTGKIRPFLHFTVLVRVRFYTKLAPETSYRFLVQRSAEDALADLCEATKTGYKHRNPVALAREWQAILESGEVPSRAALARQLGVSRAHVTQVLRILLLPPDKLQAIRFLGDPIQGKRAGIHTLLNGIRCRG